MNEQDAIVLNRLIEVVRGFVPMANSSSALIAIGEAWESIERMKEGDDIEVSVGLDVGFRRGDNEFEEGLFACFRVDYDGIDLSVLRTRYEKLVGSDHSTDDYARLGIEGEFDESAVEDWLTQLEEISGFEEAKLTVSRDHI